MAAEPCRASIPVHLVLRCRHPPTIGTFAWMPGQKAPCWCRPGSPRRIAFWQKAMPAQRAYRSVRWLERPLGGNPSWQNYDRGRLRSTNNCDAKLMMGFTTRTREAGSPVLLRRHSAATRNRPERPGFSFHFLSERAQECAASGSASVGLTFKAEAEQLSIIPPGEDTSLPSSRPLRRCHACRQRRRNS